jgi:SnoaL-like protein
VRAALCAIALAACTQPACPTAPGCPQCPECPQCSVDAGSDEAVAAIGKVVDGWHDAAARADEAAYFGAFAPNAVFLGTDATERWSLDAFRAYAHPHFAKGKAWSFKSVRREVTLGCDGRVAWFDEDLATPNLGPARGSGVLVVVDGAWMIAQYNLAITVPNERFKEVKALLEGKE